MPSKSLYLRVLGRIARDLSQYSHAAHAKRHLARAGLSHTSRIPTYTTPRQLQCLLELALQVPRGGHALEIGSYLGASACYIAAGLYGRDATLTCIDTWQNQTMPEGERDTFEEFSRNIAPVRSMLNLIQRPSEQVDVKDIDSPLHLAFLDSDHSYEATRRDFSMVAPLVATGGFIAMHDTLYFDGVSRVLGEALADGRWRIEGCEGSFSWIRKVDGRP